MIIQTVPKIFLMKSKFFFPPYSSCFLLEAIITISLLCIFPDIAYVYVSLYEPYLFYL